MFLLKRCLWFWPNMMRHHVCSRFLVACSEAGGFLLVTSPNKLDEFSLLLIRLLWTLIFNVRDPQGLKCSSWGSFFVLSLSIVWSNLLLYLLAWPPLERWTMISLEVELWTPTSLEIILYPLLLQLLWNNICFSQTIAYAPPWYCVNTQLNAPDCLNIYFHTDLHTCWRSNHHTLHLAAIYLFKS